MKHTRLIIIASLLLVAAALFAHATYRKMLEAGVSTDLRHGQPCDAASPNPCPTP